jgi:DnaJ like chaperone protein
MGLLGTLLGGTVGFMFGGPFGAIIGGAIGSNIGGGGGGTWTPPRTPYERPGTSHGQRLAYNPLQAQQAFMIALISLAAKVAKADGLVSSEEIRSFDQFLQNNLRMSPDERKIAARIFNEARDSDIPVKDFASQIRQVMGSRRDQLRDLVTMLMMVAMADGNLHPEEERVIREVNRHLGLSPHDYDAAKAMFNPTANLESAYQTLGLTSSATDSEVKAAYRRMAKEYHPDVVANKGMGEDFVKFALDKMQAVNQAYDQIKKERGM